MHTTFPSFKGRKRYFIVLLILCVFVSGCGQTGPLKLPDDDKKEEADK